MNQPLDPTGRRQPVRQTGLHHRRRGAILSVELLLVMPILLVMFFAIIEFGILWSAHHRVKAASQVACRIATLPSSDPGELRQEMQAATSRVLQRPALVARHRISLEFPTAGGNLADQSTGRTGEPVVAVVRLPMKAAAPDLLKIFGFSLAGRELVGRTVMRKE